MRRWDMPCFCSIKLTAAPRHGEPPDAFEMLFTCRGEGYRAGRGHSVRSVVAEGGEGLGSDGLCGVVWF